MQEFPVEVLCPYSHIHRPVYATCKTLLIKLTLRITKEAWDLNSLHCLYLGLESKIRHPGVF
jgi:hypothetical protein